MNNVANISIGDYIVIQRQKYTKLHKFASLDSTATLGQDLIELRNIASHPYATTFRMIPKQAAKGKRLNTLEPCSDIATKAPSKVLANNRESGTDNRHIIDNGQSQNLSATEIEELRQNCSSSTDIVSQIVENSRTFTSKTEYSQEKYLRKKEKKYFEFVQIKRPNIRLIAEIMYRQSPDKIYNINTGSLSQIVSYSGVCSTGNYLLYESGTNGLIPATLLNAIGAQTDAHLVHMHPGNASAKQAVLALNLPDEQLNRCISVNIYSALRHYYQEYTETHSGPSSGTKRKIDDDAGESVQPLKIMRNDSVLALADATANDNETPELKSSEETSTNGGTASDRSNAEATKSNSEREAEVMASNSKTPPKQQWVMDNERACKLLKREMDGLVIVSKEHPSNILKELLPFVRASRPVVIYNVSKEILAELYVDLKTSSQVTKLHLTSNWLRMYQVLENRTHPDVSMNGTNGYLLCGYTVSS